MELMLCICSLECCAGHITRLVGTCWWETVSSSTKNLKRQFLPFYANILGRKIEKANFPLITQTFRECIFKRVKYCLKILRSEGGELSRGVIGGK